jgi:hypothetical protein
MLENSFVIPGLSRNPKQTKKDLNKTEEINWKFLVQMASAVWREWN